MLGIRWGVEYNKIPIPVYDLCRISTLTLCLRMRRRSVPVYDLCRISTLSLCFTDPFTTSLCGQTEQREEPRAVSRELGAELCTRMPLEARVVDPMPAPDLIWIEMRRGPRAPARHLAPTLWNAIRCCPALRCDILWHSVARSGTQWHPDALSDNPWQFMALIVALRGNQRPSPAVARGSTKAVGAAASHARRPDRCRGHCRGRRRGRRRGDLRPAPCCQPRGGPFHQSL